MADTEKKAWLLNASCQVTQKEYITSHNEYAERQHQDFDRHIRLENWHMEFIFIKETETPVVHPQIAR